MTARSAPPAEGDEAAAGAAAAALDENFAELLAWYGSWPGGEVLREPDIWLCSSGVPFRAINAAVRARVAPDGLGERVATISGWLTERTDRWRWLVGPTARPADLEGRLHSSGLVRVSDNPGMALDLRRWEAPIAPPGVAIEPVSDERDLERWLDVQRRSLDLDEVAAEAWWTAHRRPGFEPGLPLRNWVAFLDRRPVAAAALFVGAGVAGIYNVGTVPESRGRGIGAAVTAAALTDAVARGLSLAVLGSSELGHPVYRRLGFRDVSRVRSYAVP